MPVAVETDQILPYYNFFQNSDLGLGSTFLWSILRYSVCSCAIIVPLACGMRLLPQQDARLASALPRLLHTACCLGRTRARQLVAGPLAPRQFARAGRWRSAAPGHGHRRSSLAAGILLLLRKRAESLGIDRWDPDEVGDTHYSSFSICTQERAEIARYFRNRARASTHGRRSGAAVRLSLSLRREECVYNTCTLAIATFCRCPAPPFPGIRITLYWDLI